MSFFYWKSSKTFERLLTEYKTDGIFLEIEFNELYHISGQFW